MKLTGRFKKLKKNIAEAMSKANLAKDSSFNHNVLANHLQGCNVNELKTDLIATKKFLSLQLKLQQGRLSVWTDEQ